MSGLFITVLNMSLTASFVAIIVLIVRCLLRPAPKIFSYALWGIVLFRLLCPFSFESAVSLLPEKREYIPYDIVASVNPTVNSGLGAIDNPVTQGMGASLLSADPTAGVNPLGIVLEISAIIWLLGIIVFLGYGVFSYFRLKNRLEEAILLRDNIYETDRIQTPFVLGIIKPKIFIPTGLTQEELEFIIKHEQVHIKRKDYLIKPIAYSAVVLHWFNPLMWLCYSLMNKDMEMSCDESVLKQFGEEDVRVNYSKSLFSLSKRQSGLLIPLAFGESNVKSRIKNILGFRKPTFWYSFAVFVIVAAVAVGLTANPLKTDESLVKAKEFLQYKTEYVGNAPKVGNIVYLLDYPENVHYDHLQLFTDSPPYGVTVYLKADKEYNAEAMQETLFIKNALIMFSLIGNVEYINFDLTGDEKNYFLQYTREWADIYMGQDVRNFAKGKEEFADFLKRIDTFTSEENSFLSAVFF